MAEMCDSSRECQATRSRASDGEKDYAGMRDMQRKFIDADHELRALKEEFAEVETRADDAVKARDVLLGQIFDQQNATAVKDKGWSETVCVAREQRDEADARADAAEKRAKSAEAVCSILRTNFDVLHMEEEKFPVLGYALRAHEKEYPKKGTENA